MKKLILFAFFIGVFSYGQTDREVEYIQKYAGLAVEEMQNYKIPASITLAQGILETGGGQSRLAEKANNHFGIKCKKEWKGATIYHDDDAIGECFRKYADVKDSYRDHSKFLAERPYYRRLFKLNIFDYKGWARGLKKAGYATNPMYAKILISKIEKHNLHEFDKVDNYQVYDKLVAMYGPMDSKISAEYYKTKGIIIAKVDSPVEKSPSKVKRKKKRKPLAKVIKEIEVIKEDNPKVTVRYVHPKARIKVHPIGREYIQVIPGETINQISKMYKISKSKLMRYNELDRAEDLLAGQNIFFNKKKNKGANKYYTAKSGESMYFIAQKNGIKLKQLYRRNRLKKGYQPKAGEALYLRGRKPRK